jgi:hypothetical protein
MKVAIIGAGPAGLAAAHAAMGLDCEVVVIAPKFKTPQNGPLLMQRPIPGINKDHPDGTIHQVVIGGSILDYRYKLYGDINININGDQLRESYHAWRHRETYDQLWALYSGLITDDFIEPWQLASLHERFDLVVSTASAKAMCRSRTIHKFEYKAVAVTSRAEYPNQPDNTIIFNGGEEHFWVRSSKIFGVPVTEWPISAEPTGSRVIMKPISTDCNCYPHVLRTGRFGAFKNEVWVDTAYWDTYTAIESMMSADVIARIK